MPHMLGLFCEKNMTIQTVSLGTAPSGAGGDTFRSTGAKMNENFTNNSHAASRFVGTANGDVMEVGAFGLGRNQGDINSSMDSLVEPTKFGWFKPNDQWNPVPGNYLVGVSIRGGGVVAAQLLIKAYDGNGVWIRSQSTSSSWGPPVEILTRANTTTDSNGFIKAASPVVQIFANKITANDEALKQNPFFEKVDVGHYLVKNTDGFAKEGWWIEVPTDSNGNRICAVEYQALENGDLEIKTFKKKLNDEGDIVANLDAPIDIPSNTNGEPRWIDIRLHSIPKPTIHKVPRTEKQPRMIQQLKYAMQPSYMTRLTDLIDDQGQVVIVEGKPFQKKETYLVTDAQGIATLTKQPLVNEKGEPVFEWVQAVDSEGQSIFDDVPVLDADGNQIYDEVTYEPQQ